MDKAILNLAVAAVSPVIGKLIEKLSASYLGGDVTFEEIKKLHTIILPQIHIAIMATEEISIDKLKPWLMDLKAAAFEAEDVLDLYEYKVIENKTTSDYKALQKFKAKTEGFFADMLPKTKLKKSLEKLKQSANEAKDLLPFIAIRQTTPQWDAKSQQSTPTVSRMSSPIFGRKGESINLINMLINKASGESTCSRTCIPVLAVIGIGGAGKTTMAQAIYNDPGVEIYFDTRMWVHVSRKFDVLRVTREIIEHGGSRCSDISSLNVLQKMVEEILNSKKFLLVLDDIWCEDKEEWDKFLAPLNEVGNKGSRILITTRTKRMALSLGVKNENLVPLNELKVGDILSILKYYAFGNAEKIIEDRALADVGEKIANKLNNSPLAARLIGSLLGGIENVDEWEMVLRRDMPSEPLDRLLLSFQFLRPHLQRCFAFCSLFPKGHIFGTEVIDDLVRIWIAEGFVEVPEDNELTTVEKGRQYFNELASYSFFQSRPDDPSTYVIHDLLHDLAEKVSKGHCLRIEDDGPEDIPTTTVHLSIVNRLPPMPFLDVSVLVNLRTLMCIGSLIDNSLLDVCTKLRVLYSIPRLFCPLPILSELPRSIGQLKHLRYLTKYRVKQLPDSFSKLYHLQFLHLPYAGIERVPKSFSNLVNLQCLLPGSLARIKIPEIGKLTSLQTLGFYRAETSREFGIGQLKNLNQLRGSLKIEGLENVKDLTEATEARLNQKKHLEEVTLQWRRSISRDGRVDEEVLEGMEPHSRLKKLEIREYRGAKTPSWMPRILLGLQSLRLIDCPNLTGVPRLPDSLNTLTVWNCPELKQLSPFPHALEELTINNSLGFEDLFSIFISFNDDDDDREEEQWSLHQQNCGHPQPFALGKLTIEDCSVLRGETFNLSLRKFDILSSLELKRLPKLTSVLLGPNLEHLRGIGIKKCENLQYLEGIGALPRLEGLSFDDLPELIRMGNLQALKSLTVFRCPKLTTGARAGREGAIAGRLPSLEGEVFIDEIRLLPVLLAEQGLNSIVGLSIYKCSQDTPFSSAEEEQLFLQLTSVKTLYFRDCDELPSLLADLQKLSSLEKLDIFDCREMESLPNLPTSLTELKIRGCPKLQSLEGIGALHHLRSLEIGDLPELIGMGNLQALTSIRSLKVSKCPKLTTGVGSAGRRVDDPMMLTTGVKIDDPMLLAVLLEEQCLNSIERLIITGCSQDRPFNTEEEELFLQLASIRDLDFEECKKLPSLPANLQELPSLKRLIIWRCPEMESLPNLPTSLKQLRIWECPKMESLPNLPTSLNEMNIRSCPKLKDKYGVGGPLHHKIRHIPDIFIY